MIFDVHLTIESFDRHGKLIGYSHGKANSVLRAFVDFLHAHVQQAGVSNGATDTTNTNKNTAASNTNFNSAGAAGDTTLGIVLGTGTGAVSVTDYRVYPLIAHGNSSSQLAYGANLFVDPSTVGSTRSFKIQRNFVNNSGGDISVTEVGWYFNSAGYRFCGDRTLKSFMIVNGGTTRVTYTIGVTV